MRPELLLQGVASLLMLVAALLPWLKFPLLGTPLYVPGFLLRGVWVIPLALCVGAIAALRLRQPAVQAILGVTAAYQALQQCLTDVHRTDYYLRSLELSLSRLNDVLVRVGANRIDLVPTGWAPRDYVGIGVWVTLAGVLVLWLGVGLEVWSALRTRLLGSILIGLPRCRPCGERSPWNAVFCPHCGQFQGGPAVCPQCRHRIDPKHRYCSRCGYPNES